MLCVLGIAWVTYLIGINPSRAVFFGFPLVVALLFLVPFVAAGWVRVAVHDAQDDAAWAVYRRRE